MQCDRIFHVFFLFNNSMMVNCWHKKNILKWLFNHRKRKSFQLATKFHVKINCKKRENAAEAEIKSNCFTKLVMIFGLFAKLLHPPKPAPILNRSKKCGRASACVCVRMPVCIWWNQIHAHTMTTSTTPTSQYTNNTSFGSSRSNNHNSSALESDSYADYLCGVYNQRVLFETASTTTTSTTFANLSTRTVSSCCSAPDLLATATLQQKTHSMYALPSLKSDLLLTDTSLFSVYHFIKSFITG